jgi:hypothetical protein
LKSKEEDKAWAEQPVRRPNRRRASPGFFGCVGRHVGRFAGASRGVIGQPAAATLR